MNALKMLKADHQHVKQLLSELVETSNRAAKKREELLSEISQDLRVHAKIENDIFYPAFREAGKKSDKPIFFEAVEEHRAVENLVLPDLEKSDLSSDEFAGRAKVLKDLIEHHSQEEENEMFPRAKELMSEEQLMALGEQMEELKTSLLH